MIVVRLSRRTSFSLELSTKRPYAKRGDFAIASFGSFCWAEAPHPFRFVLRRGMMAKREELYHEPVPSVNDRSRLGERALRQSKSSYFSRLMVRLTWVPPPWSLK